MKSKTVKTSLVSFLLILGWALYLFERSPELSRSTEAVRLEVSRFLYKRFYEPRCVPPGVELGIEQSRDLTFEICDNFSITFEGPTAGPKRIRVYIFEHFATLIEPKDPAPPQLCSERDFHHILATNHTGFIVSERTQADLFYIPYYAGCLSRDALRREARSGNLMREYVATLNALPEWRRFGGADFFSYTQRHFTERVAYGLPIRDLMREVPLIWLVPEITLLTAKEVADPEKAWRLSRVVIIPQPPVRSRVIAVEGHERYEKNPPRAFRFAFVGGIINAERRRLVRALRIRPDVFVRAGCRAERYDAFDMDLESIYASADFCIVPSGDAFSSRRTFDALRMGCVPVLTNPLMLLPFPDQIDYDDFVLYLDAGRTADINAQLDHIVATSENAGVPGVTPTSSRRQLAIEAAKSLAMEDCTYAGGVRLAVEAASTRSSPLRATFTAQPAVKTKGYEEARLNAYRFEW
jgi:hypothetical protein